MCIIFYLSAPLDRMVQRHLFFLLLLEVKLLHGVESCTCFKQEIKWGWGRGGGGGGVGRREAGSAHRQRRRDRRTSRAGARPEITVRPAMGLLPRCRRRPKCCPSSPSPTEGDTSGSVTSGENRKILFFEGRKIVLPPLSCLDLERMRVCE